MAKPSKIVLKSDEQKKFSQSGAIEAIRKLAEVNGWTDGFVVFVAAKHFAPRMPADVKATEIEAAMAEIVALGKQEKGKRTDNSMSFNDEMEEAWKSQVFRNSGVTLNALERRFAAEIKDGVEITMSMANVLKSELAAEKVKIAELVDEQADQDPLVAGVKMPCVSSLHRGENKPMPAGQRHLLERGDDGQLHRRQHGKGAGGDIIAGDFMKADTYEGELPPGVIKVEEAGKVIFGLRHCVSCSKEARDDFNACKDMPKDHPDWVDRHDVLTFYTVGGLRVLLRRSTESAARLSQARDQARAGARHTFGAEMGPRKGRSDWRRTRGSSKK